MRGTDRAVLFVIPLIALAIGFWVLVLGPKREEISELDAQAAELTTAISSAEAEILAAEAARADYGSNYADVVSLGAAAPEESDQATFVYGLRTLAEQNSLQMRSFELAETGGEIAPAPAAAPVAPPAEGTTESAATPVVAAAATEAVAASVPLGSSVGPAGLPVSPYLVRYGGSFFGVADLLAGIDSSVQVKSGDTIEISQQPIVRGRLVTIDGFALVGDPVHGFPLVQASLALTTFAVPSDQGISAGATPAGPAPVESPAAPLAASTASTTSTATVTP